MPADIPRSYWQYCVSFLSSKNSVETTGARAPRALYYGFTVGAPHPRPARAGSSRVADPHGLARTRRDYRKSRKPQNTVLQKSY